jgi:zinc/manganese transport system permease protein
MTSLITHLVGILGPPSLWRSGPVHLALLVATPVALISGAVGVFVVWRGQSFLGHALSDMGATGASGASFFGVSAFIGYLTTGFLAGTAVDLWSERVRERDLATGISLAAAMGLAALFLYLLTTEQGRAGVVQTVLFGSAFAVSPSLVPSVIILAAATAFGLLVLGRPLLFITLTPEVAQARGVAVRLVGYLFTLAVVVSVEEAALVVGALMSTALLIGPAAAAIRWARRPGIAVILASLLGCASVWLGIILAYDSVAWPPAGRGWPVSFLVAAVVFLVYVASVLSGRRPTARKVAA